MKIALLCPEYPPDSVGGGGVVFEALNQAYSLRHSVTVIAGSTGLRTSVDELTGDVTRVRSFPLPDSKSWLATTLPPTPRGAKTLWSTIKNADIVHAHGYGFPTVDLGIRIAAGRGIPVVHTLHGYPVSQSVRGPAIKAAFRLYAGLSGQPALRRAVRHTAVSGPVATLYADRFGLTAQVIPNGVELPAPSASWPELASWKARRLPIITSVGRLEWIKGFEDSIRALSYLPAHHRPLLVIAGRDNGLQGDLVRLSCELGVSDNTVFAGQLSRQQLVALYEASSCCVVSSRTEAFPAVPLEAMTAGVPVICTELPAVLEYASGTSACAFYEAGDHRRLGDLFTQLLDSPELRAEFAERGVKVAQQFTWDRVSRRYEELFEEVIR